MGVAADMHDPEEFHSLKDNASKVIPFPREEEDDSRYERKRMWSLAPGAVFVLVGLIVLTLLTVGLDPHRRTIFLGATVAFLLFVGIFAALIVRSYHRDKEKLMKKNPYRGDHIIQ